MTRYRTAIAAALALACAGCVQDRAPPPEIAGLSTERQCFFVDNISGYGEAPDGPRGERLYVRTNIRDRWLLETFGPCQELDWALQVGIDTRLQSSLCTGEVATLVVPRTGTSTPDRCSARVLGKMVEAT